MILAVCRVVGWLGRFAGQTQAVGEMIGGILIGPSFLGLLTPPRSSGFPGAVDADPLRRESHRAGDLHVPGGTGVRHRLIRGRLRKRGMISASGRFSRLVTET